jgi:hypothetical protein
VVVFRRGAVAAELSGDGLQEHAVLGAMNAVTAA